MEARDDNKIPSGFVQLNSGILLSSSSPALARIIKQYMIRKAAAAKRVKKDDSIVVRGFCAD